MTNPTAHELIDESVDLIIELSRLLRATSAAHAGISDIPVGQVRAMAHLYQAGRCSIGELAAGLSVSLPSASELVARLVDGGWVERGSCPDDRRRTLVRLTSRATAIGDQVMAMRRAQTQSAFDRLDANDQAALVRGLRALVAALSEPVSIAPFTSTDQ